MTGRRGCLLLIPALAALLGLAGCSNSSPSEPAGQDSIQIATLSPAPGTALHAGATASFKVVLNYGLVSSPTAMVVITATDQNGRILNSGNQPTTIVPEGVGTVSMSFQQALPATGVSQLQLIFSLQSSIPLITPPTATAAYPVS